MNADPTVDADRHMAARASYTDALDAAAARIAEQTARLVREADMDARCEHLPSVADYGRRSGTYIPRRDQRLGEALSDALDSRMRPDWDSALRLLCLAARGDDIRADAAELMKTLCDRLGEQHAEVCDESDDVPRFLREAA